MNFLQASVPVVLHYITHSIVQVESVTLEANHVSFVHRKGK